MPGPVEEHDFEESAEHLAQAKPPVANIQYHHVQFYVDKLETIEHYTAIQDRMNAFGPDVLKDGVDEAALTAQWTKMSGETVDQEAYDATGQDMVDQLLHGAGWRIVGHHKDSATESVILSSRANNGVHFVVTTQNPGGAGAGAGAAAGDADAGKQDADDRSGKRQKPAGSATYHHFSEQNVDRFYNSQNKRQGVGTLAFQVEAGGAQKIFDRYAEKHPKLLHSKEVQSYEGFKIVEVFAYYKPVVGADGAMSGTATGVDADTGTVMRYVESTGESDSFLPGVTPIMAVFPEDATCPAFFDHWVSNVVSRTGFLDTLYDCLGFTPKVDFNAGVVAAGEAQIESTVTGNTSGFTTDDKEVALVNQSQVYLPINNALSEVGHVHLYLKEVGQGIQHLASRVENLPAFVANANKMRRVTGHGFDFLKIPRSYYGRLTLEALSTADAEFGLEKPLSAGLADGVMHALRDLKLADWAGIVDMGFEEKDVVRLQPNIPPMHQAEFGERQADIGKVVARSQYINLYKMLRDHVTLETYRQIVINNVLVDIQGDDVLFQIFTKMVLQRKAGQEAPFLEFIQRVCSEQCDADGCPKKIVPGCGGFGIRNFLTLFLSIELGKASAELEDAELLPAGEALTKDKIAIATEKIMLFTTQLEESNPVLTEISDAMTAEGTALDKFAAASTKEAKEAAQAEFDQFKLVKEAGNKKLQGISFKFKNMARALRERGEALASQ
eukprot:gene6528-10749_t